MLPARARRLAARLIAWPREKFVSSRPNGAGRAGTSIGVQMSDPEVPRRAKWRETGVTPRREGVGVGRPERLVITAVSPSVAGGAYPSKRAQNDVVEFAAIVVCDGAMEIGAQLRLISPDGQQRTLPLTRGIGYTFSTEVALDQLGVYEFVVDAWIDRAATLRSKITRKQAAGQPTTNEEEELRLPSDAPTSDHISSRVERVVV